MKNLSGKWVYAVATMDTKGEELDFVAGCLRSAGIATKTVDVGTACAPVGTPDIPREELANVRQHGGTETGDAMVACDVKDLDRGTAVTEMGIRLTQFLLREAQAGKVAGVIGLGGSGGTALITAAMRTLPIGLPKFMVSTVASGNTAPYVDCSDMTMMFSVVDVAGLNRVSRRVLANAAHAMAGMVSHETPDPHAHTTVGLTMFGVTTPCVSGIRKSLERLGYECLVFHATGTGGRAMEQLVASGLIQGVVDITTTEVADELVGGVFPCGPNRFDKILASKIPYLLSLGALDMANFGALDTVPEQFRNRNLYVHNAQVTLMRTTPSENVEFAKWMAKKLNRSEAPVTVLIPERGLSALDIQGGVFHDPESNEALFSTLESSLRQSELRQLIRLPYHINDREFSDAAVKYFQLLTH